MLISNNQTLFITISVFLILPYLSVVFAEYSKQLYDLVPTHQLKNLPPSLKARLLPYEFIFVVSPFENSLQESGRAQEITADRSCKVCQYWTLLNDSISCSTCKNYFHLNCISMAKVPSRGFVWMCHYCLNPSLKVQEDTRSTITDANSTDVEHDQNITPIWPYFYLGEHSEIDDILGPLNPDRCYPRFPSRYKTSSFSPKVLASLIRWIYLKI
jgi:hypothetical protein